MSVTHSLDEVLNTPQKKLAFFQNLVLVAAADGQLDPQEGDFLLEIGNQLGLGPDEVSPIADNLACSALSCPPRASSAP